MILFLKKNWRLLTFGLFLMIAGLTWGTVGNIGQNSQENLSQAEKIEKQVGIPSEPYVN